MMGLIRAEWLRLRKRRSLQVILLAVPLLVALPFVLGYNSIYDQPPFDEAAYRQELLDGGFGIGLSPEELEPLLQDAIRSQREMIDQINAQTTLIRAGYAFPYSLVTILGNGTLVLLALILLTATTIGDEFGWATIRTTFLASSNRVRFLAVRLGAMALAGLLIFGLLLVLGVVLPLLLSIPPSKLPPQLPAFDAGAFLVLVGGEVLAALAVIAFAALIALLFRNGAVTFVAAVIWVAVEAAILTLLFRFPNFAPGGSEAWVLEAFPLRGLTTLLGTAGRAASGLPGYPGEPVVRDLGLVPVPLISFAVIAIVLAAAASRRIRRMDIVE